MNPLDVFKVKQHNDHTVWEAFGLRVQRFAHHDTWHFAFRSRRRHFYVNSMWERKPNMHGKDMR